MLGYMCKHLVLSFYNKPFHQMQVNYISNSFVSSFMSILSVSWLLQKSVFNENVHVLLLIKIYVRFDLLCFF